MTEPRPHLIAFRVTDEEHELLNSYCAEGESPAKAARRLLLEELGALEKVPSPAPSAAPNGITRVKIEEPALLELPKAAPSGKPGPQRGWNAPLPKVAVDKDRDESGEAMSVREVGKVERYEGGGK